MSGAILETLKKSIQVEVNRFDFEQSQLKRDMYRFFLKVRWLDVNNPIFGTFFRF